MPCLAVVVLYYGVIEPAVIRPLLAGKWSHQVDLLFVRPFFAMFIYLSLMAFLALADHGLKHCEFWILTATFLYVIILPIQCVLCYDEVPQPEES